MGFTRNEQMGCSEDFRVNENDATYPRNVTSHVGTPRNVSEGNMIRPEKVQKYFGRKYDQAREGPKMTQKQSKLKVIIHVLGLSRGPSSERHGMHPRDMGGHWKEVMWLGTNMWMPLDSLRGNFGFHEK